MEHPVHGGVNFHSVQMVVEKHANFPHMTGLYCYQKISIQILFFDNCRNINSAFEKFLECGIHFNPSSRKEKFHTSGVTIACSKV